ncbi:receptor expression-enhancing protein 1-like isoform X2 [Polyodon spathula]|uniref:receptor expression-enhancing protein 1-like isoform X2 n=1 Tax=Polyodon spathula TaxID=7913 RepID=UPI001B7F177C|nr:receptor expression-enhancing protein 1-like isoform X2 [Polyodon spathula]
MVERKKSRLIFGTLYPAYSSYKAVKSKDIKDYVKWMMYWIIFALFTTAETITDIFLSWIPFYYELKIAFVVWLLSPYTKGSSVLYRKFVHPTLTSKEKEIDDYLCQAKDKSYDALVHFGRKGLNVAATAAVTAAAKVSQLPEIIKYGDFKEVKGQGALSERLRSFSMQDLSTIQRDEAGPVPGPVPSKTPTAQPRSRTIARSKSENTSACIHCNCSLCSGDDVDITEYEVLSKEQCDAKELLLQSKNNDDAIAIKPEPRLPKRRAPEPPPRVLKPRSRSKSTSSSNSENM